MEYRFRPRPLALSAYDHARDEFIARYARHPDVLGIYQFGSVSNPGISDLDFIVVVEESLSQPVTRDYGYDYFSEETSFVLSHDPIVIPVDVAPHLWKLYPILGEVVCHYGSADGLTRIGGNGDSINTALNLMAVCFKHYPWFFIFLRQRGFLDVRLSLQVLNALRHAKTLSEDLGLDTFSDAPGLFERLDRLQTGWFEITPEEAFGELESLLDWAEILSASLVRDVADYATDHIGQWGGKTPSKHATIVGRYDIGNYLFLDHPAGSDLAATTRKLWAETGQTSRVLLKEFMLPLLFHLQYGGLVGPVVARNLSTIERNDEIFLGAARAVGMDMAGQYDRLFRFFQTNPINLSMSPDPYGLFAESTFATPSIGGLTRLPLQLARRARDSMRLRRVGVRTQKLRLRSRLSTS